MSRSTWKLPFSEILQKIQKKREITKRQVWSRASTVLPQHLGLQVFVHNGKNFIRVQVVEQMIGHKYGEFATTRKRAFHKTKALQRSSRKK